MTSEIINHDPEWKEKKMDLLKSTICKGLSSDEIEFFSYVCQRTSLDPFVKQIYPVMRYDGKLGKNVMTIQTGIDGFRLVAERTGKYCPGLEPTYEYDENGNLLKATAFIRKMTPDGTWHDVSASAYYSEYVQTYKDKATNKMLVSKFWAQMPRLMLAKCAESLVLRKAFPADLSGIYTGDEMSQASSIDVIDVEPSQPEQVIVQPALQLLSEGEYKELMDLIKKVTPGFKKNFEAMLLNQGINGYDKIPKSVYIAQKQFILAHINKKEEEVPF